MHQVSCLDIFKFKPIINKKIRYLKIKETGILHIYPEVVNTFFEEALRKSEYRFRKCKVLLKDANYCMENFVCAEKI